MGYTNAVTIQQSNVTFIVMDEMPEHAACFIDDVVAKGTRSYYKKEDGLTKRIRRIRAYEDLLGNTPRRSTEFYTV